VQSFVPVKSKFKWLKLVDLATDWLKDFLLQHANSLKRSLMSSEYCVKQVLELFEANLNIQDAVMVPNWQRHFRFR